MEFDIDEITNEILHEIYKNENFNSFNAHIKTNLIYNYLTNMLSFDYDILSIRNKIRQEQIDLCNTKEEDLDFLLKRKDYSKNIAKTYKCLLEKVKIPALIVVGNYDGNIHYFNLVKRGEYWSFDDVTLSVVKNEKTYYFDYDKLEDRKQVAIGIMPNEDGQTVKKVQELNDDLIPLPTNIKSYKQEGVCETRKL